jgi:threonine/homoserine/homoserine lactone efflux protein
MDPLLGFIIAALALAGSPGPNTLSLAATGAAFGTRRSARYLIGISVGMLAVMVIAGSAVIALLFAIPGARPVVIATAALYFAYLAWRIATAPPLSSNLEQGRPPSFSGGVFLSLVNPKAYAAMAALFSDFALVPQAPAADAAVKTMMLMLVIIAVNVAWLIAGSSLTRFFREPRLNRGINLTFAVLLILSVAAVLWV